MNENKLGDVLAGRLSEPLLPNYYKRLWSPKDCNELLTSVCLPICGKAHHGESRMDFGKVQAISRIWSQLIARQKQHW